MRSPFARALPGRALWLVSGASAWVALAAVVAVAVSLARSAGATDDVGTVLQSTWNPARNAFGLLPFLVGTIAAAVLSMAIALPVGVLAGVYLAEIASPRVARGGALLLELCAATPAVVIGFWGRTALVPALREMVSFAFGMPEGRGFGLVAASLVLAAMAIPTIATLCRAILRALPDELREGPMALGATRWETIRAVLLPAARRGLMAAAALGFGRALGETVAVSMVVGGRPSIWPSLTAPSATLSSVLVDEALDATHPAHIAALALIALVLLVFGLLTRIGARLLARRAAAEPTR